jgi:hypothetical protein
MVMIVAGHHTATTTSTTINRYHDKINVWYKIRRLSHIPDKTVLSLLKSFISTPVLNLSLTFLRPLPDTKRARAKHNGIGMTGNVKMTRIVPVIIVVWIMYFSKSNFFSLFKFYVFSSTPFKFSEKGLGKHKKKENCSWDIEKSYTTLDFLFRFFY